MTARHPISVIDGSEVHRVNILLRQEKEDYNSFNQYALVLMTPFLFVCVCHTTLRHVFVDMNRPWRRSVRREEEQLGVWTIFSPKLATDSEEINWIISLSFPTNCILIWLAIALPEGFFFPEKGERERETRRDKSLVIMIQSSKGTFFRFKEEEQKACSLIRI